MVNDILEEAVRVDDLAGVRQGTHIAVAHANEVGAPVGTVGVLVGTQGPEAVVTGTSKMDKGKGPGKKRVSDSHTHFGNTL